MSNSLRRSPEKTERWVKLAFIAAITGFFLLVFLTTLSINAYLSSTDRIGDALRRDASLHLLVSSLADMQRATRGYTIAGDSSFLEPYATGMKGFTGSLADLREMCSESPEKLRRLEAIASLAETMIREVDGVVEHTRLNEPDLAREAVKSGRAKKALEGIENIAHQMTVDENRYEAEQSALAETDLHQAILFLVIGSTFSFGVIIAIFLFIRRQVREQQRLADVSQRSEQRLQLVINSIREGVTFSNAEGRFEIFNPRMREMTGYTLEEANRSNDFSRLLYPDPADHQRALDGVRELINGKGPYSSVSVITSKSGERKTIRASSQMLGLLERKMFLTTCQDITEERRAEAAVHESEQRYRLLFAASPIPIWIFDFRSLAFLEVNSAAVQNYGYSREEFLSMTLRDIRPPEDVPHLVEVIAKLEEGVAHHGMWRHIRKDGTPISVEITNHRLEWKGHEACLAIVHDLTERLRAEEELRIQKTYFERLFESMPEGIALIDESQHIHNVNRAFEQMFGYGREELVSREITSVLIPERYRERVRDNVEAVMSGVGLHVETRQRRKNGEAIEVSITATPVELGQGQRMAYGIVRDITQKKESERERENLILQLQEALADVKILSGLLPMCAWCKKVRDDSGYYHQIEAFLAQHSDATFTHGICPDCRTKMVRETGVSDGDEAAKHQGG